MKVLIFTASAGNGHNSTAKRITEKIKENMPNAEIEVVDAYKSCASKMKAWVMEKGYFLACKYFVNIYNHFFKKSEKTNIENKDKSKVHKDTYPLVYGMLKKIYEFQPDVIIPTYIFCAVALMNIKRYYHIPAKIICMTLDYGVSPYWECCASGLDKMFLTDNYMVEPFKARGFTDEQLVVSGIPVADKFSKPIDKKKACALLGLDENLFTLVIMKASFFPVSNGDIVKQLSKINQKIQVVIVNGKDKKCQDDIDRRIKKADIQHALFNIGFTDKIVEYFSVADLVLGKAGGLSTTEAINAGIPSLIVNKLPQQEVYNKQFMIDNGCALGVDKNNIAKTINELLEDKDKCRQLKENALRLRKPDTLDKLYEVISSFGEADYSNLTLSDTKSQTIKNIDKQRKLAANKQKEHQK